MKILVYGFREDEAEEFELARERLGIEIVCIRENLNRQTVEKAAGFRSIAINAGSLMDRENVARLAQLGVQNIATRSIGFDNVDLDACKEFGLRFANVHYSAHSVADYTVMLMLMLTRRMRDLLRRGEVQDYGYLGYQGRELHNLTVGVVGTGRIGRTVIEDLAGFGCKILGYDLYPNETLKKKIEYLPLEQLLARADIITLHAPLQDSSYHMINEKSIAGMKDGAMLINTARGELVDTAALIDGIESGKLGGAALDVLEGERAYTFSDRRGQVIKSRERALLQSFPNVILTGHYAFYTDQAVSDMVNIALEALLQLEQTGHADSQIV